MGEAKRRAAIPSLKNWLSQWKSADATARDETEAFMDWTAHLLELKNPSDPAQARSLRFLKTLSIAIVESANHEAELGAGIGDIHCDMVRQMGIAFGFAFMSLSWKDETPFRSFVRPFSEDFATGMKFAIDSCLEDENEPEAAHG